MSNIDQLDMCFGLLDVIVAQDKLVNILRSVDLAFAQEFFLANVDQLLNEVTSCFWSHNPVSEASHSFIAENVSQSIFLSTFASLALRCTENIVLFRVDRTEDHIGAEVCHILELMDL
jgi:hypothetical protein